MVFSDADPTFSISSILSRYDPSVSSTGSNSRPTPSRANSDKKPPPIARPNGTATSKTATSTSTTTTTLSRPSSSVSKPGITGSASRTSITSAVTSSKTDAGAIAKKRKVEDPQSSLDMLRQRAALLAKAKKEKATSGSNTTTSTGTNKPLITKISTVGNRPVPSSAGNTPTEAVKKPGYKELLARAAQAQAEMKSAPGTITHKARPQVKEQRAWQKKLEEKKAGKAGVNGNERSSKSPGITSGGEKGSATGKKVAEPVKTVAGKKGVGGVGVDSRRSSLGNVHGTAAKGKIVDKSRNGSTVDVGVKRKRESPPRGGSSRGGNGYALPRKNMSRRYDNYEEDEDDDFVVDDEDDVPARGPRHGGGGGRKYTYYESDYDSGSDMEAAGIDVLEEEERSGRAAVIEDQAQEKLDRELAARKAALKKKLVKPKK